MNYLGRLRDREVVDPVLLDDGHRSRTIMRNGLEDGRLIRFDGRLYGLFSGFYQGEGRWSVSRNTMVLLELEGEYRTYPEKAPQKNWMPFVRENRLLAVTHTKPLKILDLMTGEMVHEGPGLEEFWSGSSQLIPDQGGWLGVVHRHNTKTDRFGTGWVCRDYIHAFLRLDDDFSPSLSPPFRFFGEGVEFCAGIERFGDEICLSFGVHDRESYLTWLC